MVYYGYNDARKRANEKYLKNSVDSVMTRVPKGRKADLQLLADQRNLSLNALMNRIIDYALKHPEIIEKKEQ